MQNIEIILSTIVTSTLILLLLVTFIFKIIFLYRKKEIAYLKEIELIKSNYEKELLQTQLEIQEQIFQHISLELHDHVGHLISLSKLYLSTINLKSQDSIVENIDASIRLLGSSLEEIRNISRSLNTENLNSNGLLKSLNQLVEQIKRTGLFVITLEVTGKPCYLDEQKEIVLFRIIQEALNNTVRHSNAIKISILLHYDDNILFLSINDNGAGFNVDEILESTYIRSSGLKNIIRRSSLINARYEIISTPENGTTITIITPFLNEVCQQNVTK